eukprot:scaffold245_cov256-Pinguiococcus_pyrenoidosus.AAC.12
MASPVSAPMACAKSTGQETPGTQAAQLTANGPTDAYAFFAAAAMASAKRSTTKGESENGCNAGNSAHRNLDDDLCFSIYRY